MGNDEVERKVRGIHGFLSRRNTGVYVLTSKMPVKGIVGNTTAVDLYPAIGDALAWTAPVCAPVALTLLGRTLGRLECTEIVLAVRELRFNEDPDEVLRELQ